MKRIKFTPSALACCARRFLLATALLAGATGYAQTINTYAGDGSFGYGGDGGPATAASFSLPIAVLTNAAGDVLVCDFANSAIRKITPAGIITTIAGNGTPGYSGDGGQATDASLMYPVGITYDAAGNLFIADALNNVVRKVNAAGIISTVVGNGTAAYSGDGGPATAASLNNPFGVAFDAAGNMYVTDNANSVVRKVNTTTGIITTVAGVAGTGSYSGDGGPATAAHLNAPYNVAFDAAGNMFIVDYFNNRIRKVDAAGTITTAVGTGTAGYGGDHFDAANATINQPGGILFDAHGNMFIGDAAGNRIRKVNTFGTISTLAGTGATGYSGDGGPATAATLNEAYSVAFNAAGNMFIADEANNAIRVVAPVSCTVGAAGTISSSAGAFFCDSGSTVLTVAGTSAATGISFNWQFSTDGVTWLNSHTQDTALVTGMLHATTHFRAIFVCSGNNSMDTSNFTVTINPTGPASAIITAVPGTTIAAGTTVTFTATLPIIGATPAYQWQKNTVAITGATSSTYTTSTLVDGDDISCYISSSSACATTDTATSNHLIIHTNVGVAAVTGGNSNISITPNPNNGTFSYDGTITAGTANIEVLNMIGQVIYKEIQTISNDHLSGHLSLSDKNANGIYILRITTASGTSILRFAVDK